MKKCKILLVCFSFLFCSGSVFAMKEMEKTKKITKSLKDVLENCDLKQLQIFLENKGGFFEDELLTYVKDEETLETEKLSFPDLIKKLVEENFANYICYALERKINLMRKNGDNLECYKFPLEFYSKGDCCQIELAEKDFNCIRKNKELTEKFKKKQNFFNSKLEEFKKIEKFLKENNFLNNNGSLKKVKEETLEIEEISISQLKNLIFKKIYPNLKSSTEYYIKLFENSNNESYHKIKITYEKENFKIEKLEQINNLEKEKKIKKNFNENNVKDSDFSELKNFLNNKKKQNPNIKHYFLLFNYSGFNFNNIFSNFKKLKEKIKNELHDYKISNIKRKNYVNFFEKNIYILSLNEDKKNFEKNKLILSYDDENNKIKINEKELKDFEKTKIKKFLNENFNNFIKEKKIKENFKNKLKNSNFVLNNEKIYSVIFLKDPINIKNLLNDDMILTEHKLENFAENIFNSLKQNKKKEKKLLLSKHGENFYIREYELTYSENEKIKMKLMDTYFTLKSNSEIFKKLLNEENENLNPNMQDNFEINFKEKVLSKLKTKLNDYIKQDQLSYINKNYDYLKVEKINLEDFKENFYKKLKKQLKETQGPIYKIKTDDEYYLKSKNFDFFSCNFHPLKIVVSVLVYKKPQNQNQDNNLYVFVINLELSENKQKNVKPEVFKKTFKDLVHKKLDENNFLKDCEFQKINENTLELEKTYNLEDLEKELTNKIINDKKKNYKNKKGKIGNFIVKNKQNEELACCNFVLNYETINDFEIKIEFNKPLAEKLLEKFIEEKAKNNEEKKEKIEEKDFLFDKEEFDEYLKSNDILNEKNKIGIFNVKENKINYFSLDEFEEIAKKAVLYFSKLKEEKIYFGKKKEVTKYGFFKPTIKNVVAKNHSNNFICLDLELLCKEDYNEKLEIKNHIKISEINQNVNSTKYLNNFLNEEQNKNQNLKIEDLTTTTIFDIILKDIPYYDILKKINPNKIKETIEIFNEKEEKIKKYTTEQFIEYLKYKIKDELFAKYYKSDDKISFYGKYFLRENPFITVPIKNIIFHQENNEPNKKNNNRYNKCYNLELKIFINKEIKDYDKIENQTYFAITEFVLNKDANKKYEKLNESGKLKEENVKSIKIKNKNYEKLNNEEQYKNLDYLDYLDYLKYYKKLINKLSTYYDETAERIKLNDIIPKLDRIYYKNKKIQFNLIRRAHKKTTSYSEKVHNYYTKMMNYYNENVEKIKYENSNFYEVICLTEEEFNRIEQFFEKLLHMEGFKTEIKNISDVLNIHIKQCLKKELETNPDIFTKDYLEIEKDCNNPMFYIPDLQEIEQEKKIKIYFNFNLQIKFKIKKIPNTNILNKLTKSNYNFLKNAYILEIEIKEKNKKVPTLNLKPRLLFKLEKKETSEKEIKNIENNFNEIIEKENNQLKNILKNSKTQQKKEMQYKQIKEFFEVIKNGIITKNEENNGITIKNEENDETEVFNFKELLIKKLNEKLQESIKNNEAFKNEYEIEIKNVVTNISINEVYDETAEIKDLKIKMFLNSNLGNKFYGLLNPKNKKCYCTEKNKRTQVLNKLSLDVVNLNTDILFLSNDNFENIHEGQKVEKILEFYPKEKNLFKKKLGKYKDFYEFSEKDLEEIYKLIRDNFKTFLKEEFSFKENAIKTYETNKTYTKNSNNVDFKFEITFKTEKTDKFNSIEKYIPLKEKFLHDVFILIINVKIYDLTHNLINDTDIVFKSKAIIPRVLLKKDIKEIIENKFISEKTEILNVTTIDELDKQIESYEKEKSKTNIEIKNLKTLRNNLVLKVEQAKEIVENVLTEKIKELELEPLKKTKEYYENLIEENKDKKEKKEEVEEKIENKPELKKITGNFNFLGKYYKITADIIYYANGILIKNFSIDKDLDAQQKKDKEKDERNKKIDKKYKEKNLKARMQYIEKKGELFTQRDQNKIKKFEIFKNFDDEELKNTLQSLKQIILEEMKLEDLEKLEKETKTLEKYLPYKEIYFKFEDENEITKYFQLELYYSKSKQKFKTRNYKVLTEEEFKEKNVKEKKVKEKENNKKETIKK